MAKLSRLMWNFLLIYLCSGIVSSTSSLFDRILNEAEPCKELCDKTYPLHTYPDPRHSDCCKRGCRFYSLVEFINKSQNENATRDTCMASCMEAYSQTADRYACNIGCSNQVPFNTPTVELNNSEPLTALDDWTIFNLAKPFNFMNDMYNGMVDQVSRIFTVSWSLYMQQDDGRVVIIQSEPEVLTEFVDIDDLADGKTKDEDSILEVVDGRTKLSDGKPSRGSLNEPVRITVNAYATEEIKSMDWLGCVSKKSGLPRWLLGLVIFVSAMVMVWLCFATTATAPEQQLKPQPLSIYGDGECVIIKKDGLKSAKPYFDNISDEAEQLPVKVHLPAV